MAIQKNNWSVAREVPAPDLSGPMQVAVAGPCDESSRLNSCDLAREALFELKEVKVIDLVYDDRLISKLCHLSRAVTRKFIEKHQALRLGSPTEDTIDRVLIELENENVIGSGTDSI